MKRLHAETIEYLKTKDLLGTDWKVQVTLIGPCSADACPKPDFINVDIGSYHGEGEQYIQFIQSMFDFEVPAWIELRYIAALDNDLNMDPREFGKILDQLLEEKKTQETKKTQFNIIYIHSSANIPPSGHRIVKNLHILTSTHIVLTGAMAINVIPLDFPSEMVISVCDIGSSLPEVRSGGHDVKTNAQLGGSLLDFVTYTGFLHNTTTASKNKTGVNKNTESALFTVIIIAGILRRAQELFTSNHGK